MDQKYCAKGRCRLDRVIHVMMIDMLGKDVPSAMFGVIKKGAEKILGTRLHIIMVRVDKTKYFQRTLKNHSKLDSKKKHSMFGFGFPKDTKNKRLLRSPWYDRYDKVPDLIRSCRSKSLQRPLDPFLVSWLLAQEFDNCPPNVNLISYSWMKKWKQLFWRRRH